MRSLDCYVECKELVVVLSDFEPMLDSHLCRFNYEKRRITLTPVDAKENAPSTLQQTMSIALSAPKWPAVIYLDDTVAFSRSAAEHIGHAKHVVALLRDARVTQKLKSCRCFREIMDHLARLFAGGVLTLRLI